MLQVCILALHLSLSLGIFNHLWTLLEEACTELDLRLATELRGIPGLSGVTFARYSIPLERLSQLKSRLVSQTCHAELLEQLATYMSLSLPDPENSESIKAVRRGAAVPHDRVDQNYGI